MTGDQRKTSVAASDVLDRLKRVLELETDSALARRLEVEPTTIATWRRRDTLSYVDCIRVGAEELVNLNWLFTGHGGMNETDTPGYLDPFLLALALEMKQRRTGDPATQEDALIIFSYYTQLVGRFAEMYRQKVPRNKILDSLRFELALPEDT